MAASRTPAEGTNQYPPPTPYPLSISYQRKFGALEFKRSGERRRDNSTRPIANLDFKRKFNSVAESARRALRDAIPVLQPEIERILRAAYGGAGISDQRALQAIMVLQEEHYRLLLEAKFQDRFIALVNELEGKHSALGITMENYFVGFTYILNEMVAILVKEFRKKPDRLAAILPALNQVIFLEMDYTLSRHIHGIEAAAISESA